MSKPKPFNVAVLPVRVLPPELSILKPSLFEVAALLVRAFAAD